MEKKLHYTAHHILWDFCFSQPFCYILLLQFAHKGNRMQGHFVSIFSELKFEYGYNLLFYFFLYACVPSQISLSLLMKWLKRKCMTHNILPEQRHSIRSLPVNFFPYKIFLLQQNPYHDNFGVHMLLYQLSTEKVKSCQYSQLYKAFLLLFFGFHSFSPVNLHPPKKKKYQVHLFSINPHRRISCSALHLLPHHHNGTF